MFDHGLDTSQTVLQVLGVAGAVGMASFGPTMQMASYFCVALSFYLTHFEKYNTGRVQGSQGV